MAVPPPDDAEQRLRAYMHATCRHRSLRGPALPLSLPELAERVGLSRDACRRALDALVEADEVQVLVHQGGALELQPRGPLSRM